MINKPYSLLPSDLEDGSGVVNPTVQTTFSFQASGTSPIYMIAVEMCNLSASPTKSVFIEPSNPIYYTNIDGSTKTVEFSLSSAQIATIRGTTYEQQWRVILWDTTQTAYRTSVSQYQNGATTHGSYTPNYTVASDWVFVQLKNSPSLSVSTSTSVANKSNTWTATYTPSRTYVNGSLTSNSTPMRSLRWQIFDATSGIELEDTGEIYGCIEPAYEVDGLRDGHTYYAFVTVVDQDGVVTQKKSANVVVDYAEPSSGIMYLKYTNELNNYKFDYGVGQEVVMDIRNFAGSDGVSSGGDAGYTIGNAGNPIGNYLANKEGNVITYEGIDVEAPTPITVRFLFTPLAYKNDKDIGIVYLDDNETYRVRYAIWSDGGLVPDETLTPEEDLTPDVRYYYIKASFEEYTGDRWVEFDNATTFVDIDQYGANDFLYYEHSFYMYSVILRYHANGGELLPEHAESITLDDDGTVLRYGVKNAQYIGLSSKKDPWNYNNPDGINLGKTGYEVTVGQEWNTAPDGSGTTFNQGSNYERTEYAPDADTGFRIVTLYVNWHPV